MLRNTRLLAVYGKADIPAVTGKNNQNDSWRSLYMEQLQSGRSRQDINQTTLREYLEYIKQKELETEAKLKATKNGK